MGRLCWRGCRRRGTAAADVMKLKDTEDGSSGSHLQPDAWVAAG